MYYVYWFLGLIQCDLDCNYLYGQGYDGASNMSGQFKGVQTLVRCKYPKALYVHCAAHSLNLAVSTASGIKPIRNCLGLIEKAYTFFNTSKRNSVLIHVIENSDDERSTKQLQQLCATRWIQSYDSVKDFSELFPFVLSALEIISDLKDPSEAHMIKKSMEDTEFIISFNVIKVYFLYLSVFTDIFENFSCYFYLVFHCVSNYKKYKLILEKLYT